MTPQGYGWAVVAAAFTHLLIGFAAAFSFAAFFGALQAEFGAARADVALVFSAAAFIWFLSGAPAGMLADRVGPRRVTLAGVACLAGALWLASRADTLAMLYATFSLGIGLGVGLLYVPSVGAVQPWFGANRGFASGIANAGIGAGNIAGPLLAAACIALLGWRGAFVALALFVLLLGLPAALAIRQHPSAMRRESPPGATPAQALRTRAFWLLYASLVLTCVGLFVPMVHLAPYAQDAGHSAAEGVALVSLVGLGSLIGRFAIGGLADRLGRSLSLALMYAGLGVMLIVWWLSSAWWLLAAFAFLFGVCYGGYVALLPPIVMDLYGARDVSGIIGLLYTGAGLGTLAGPWLAGAAFDAYGSYDLPILAGAACSLLAAACVLPLVPHEKEAGHRG